jgi:hypothetical protein
MVVDWSTQLSVLVLPDMCIVATSVVTGRELPKCHVECTCGAVVLADQPSYMHAVWSTGLQCTPAVQRAWQGYGSVDTRICQLCVVLHSFLGAQLALQ